MKYILIILLSLFFVACSTKETQLKQKEKSTELRKTYIKSKKINTNFINQKLETKKFLKIYFNVWKQKKVSYPKKDAMWGLNYQYREIYLENYKLANKKWFEKQEKNSNFKRYNTLAKKAITLRNTNVRVFPTNSPMFLKPSKAGEGFPFDYNQNSLLKINTPLIVSHLSKDRAWAYIQSSIVGGWVRINDIAFVNKKFIKKFKTNNYYISVKEKFPIYDNVFREYVKIATIFPKKKKYFLIAKADKHQNAKISYIKIKNNKVKVFPLKFNKKNIKLISKEFLGEPYGWGGILNNRDCSSFTQDFFANFGKFLNRNSKAQIRNGKYYDISNLSNKEKKYYIIKNAVPYSTLIYLKGHIMLFVGVKNNEPLVMHNMWSIILHNKKGEEYRHIIGKTTITTLDVGKNLKNYSPDKNILSRIEGIIVL